MVDGAAAVSDGGGNPMLPAERRAVAVVDGAGGLHQLHMAADRLPVVPQLARALGATGQQQAAEHGETTA